MSQPIILVTFSCQTGDIEKLALGAAVGAVQARALIRLRRIHDVESDDNNEEVIRMRKEYVKPAEADVVGADALIVAANANTNVLSAPWQEFLSLLSRLSREGKLNRKVGASIGGISPALGDLGFVAFTQPPSDALALGRGVAEMARSLKTS